MQASRRSSWYLVPLRNIQIRANATAAESQNKVRPYSEVPGPKPLPLLGNAWRFLPVIGTFQVSNFYKWSEQMYEQYGEIVKLSDVPGRNDMVMVMNAECIEKVFRSEGQWPQRFPLQSFQYFRNKVRKDYFEGFEGLVNEVGEAWQKARTVVNQPMMQPKVTKQYAAKIDQVAQDFVKRIPDLRDEKLEMPSDFSNELHKWSLESIALVALDTRMGCLDAILAHDSDPQKMIEAVEIIFETSFALDMKMPIWKLINTPTLKKFVKHSNIFLEISRKYVERAKENLDIATPEEQQSVLQKILKRDPSTKRAVIMAMDTIFTGIDTTSHTAATILYHLAHNPESQEKLFSEVSKVISAGTSKPLTADELDSMKYLKACIKEAIRISPVATGNVRVLQNDIVLNNYHIPKNVDIMMFNSTLCRMDKHYPEPDRYMPERWLRGDSSCPVTANHKTHPFVYLPFGYGPRSCVGMRFANLELETLVARVVRNYRLEWHYGEMTFVSKMLQIPNDPLKIKMIDRNT